jgi:ABC-2 type transport system permease protein
MRNHAAYALPELPGALSDGNAYDCLAPLRAEGRARLDCADFHEPIIPLLACPRVSARAVHPYGPSALGGDVRRFVELTLTLARTEFKLRYFGSILGYVWSLMRPLLFFGVLYFFFTQIIRISKAPHYGVYLLTGIVFWNYLAEATGNAVSCMVTREGLLRKVRFPRMVVPLSVSLTATFNLAMNFIAVVVFALASGISPAASWLELIPIALGFVVFATGIGMLLSALYVRFRDVAPIWEVALQAWFYASPVMYLATAYGHFGAGFKHIAMMNPVATLLTQASHAFIGATAFESATKVAGGFVPVLIALAIIPAVFALGLWFFTREAPRVAEEL